MENRIQSPWDDLIAKAERRAEKSPNYRNLIALATLRGCDYRTAMRELMKGNSTAREPEELFDLAVATYLQVQEAFPNRISPLQGLAMLYHYRDFELRLVQWMKLDDQARIDSAVEINEIPSLCGEGIKRWEDVRRRFPRNPLTLLNLGYAYLERNDLDQAEACAQQMSVKNYSRQHLLFCLRIKQGRFEEAIDLLEKEDGSPWPQLALIEVLILSKRFDEAAEVMKSLNPLIQKSAKYFQLESQLLRAVGRIEEAEAGWKTYQKRCADDLYRTAMSDFSQ